MVSIFCEPCGSPIVDAQGNLYFLTDRAEFRQRLNNLFNTQVGSEVFYPEYGFDIFNVSQLPPGESKITLLRNMVIEALNVYQVQSLYGIRSVEASITGTTGIVNIQVTDTSANEYTEVLEV